MERPQAMLTEVEERWPQQRQEGMETDNGVEDGRNYHCTYYIP